MLYNQPLAVRFGTELLRHVDQVDEVDPFWDTLDIAVAWVRASGMAYLSDRLAHFLRHGGHLSLVVGIDIQNTTREGLQALLDLEQHGWCETFVYHNEAGSVFHPKLYLFRNEEEARLIVVYCPRVLGQWFDGIRFYAAASSPTRSRRTWAGLR